MRPTPGTECRVAAISLVTWNIKFGRVSELVLGEPRTSLEFLSL